MRSKGNFYIQTVDQKGCKDILKLEDAVEKIETLRKIDVVDYDTVRNQYLKEDIERYGKQIY